MPFVVTQPCIGVKDGACIDVCPVDCIHHDGGDDLMVYINLAECIACGACDPVCPVDAIAQDFDLKGTSLEAFTTINQLWYDDPPAAREMVHEILRELSLDG